MPYHCQIDFEPALPPGLSSRGVWIKGDMVYTVGFHRLDFIRTGKDRSGRRTYYYDTPPASDVRRIRGCVLHGLGLGSLTNRL